ncbi:hypothetical protein CC78DRAFT_608772 [Lojkania enalia]|uniref:DUF2423 domain-containing protein n=1 Tax=Lojkania enalia TaxID=147567 RepID=A0A9P4K3F4_9PLEO|nr:hypothetical protein CC78DRAFT_608772 [Didymosphaeria enalia]
MAKGLRSSVKKSNKTKLRSRVFGPVEAARTERLAAKLLELAQQPKPERPQKPDMEIDSTEGIPTLSNPSMPPYQPDFVLPESTITTGQEANKEDAYPKGSCFLTANIPRSLSDTNTSFTLDDKTSAQDDCENRNLFHLLGLCSDVVGFTPKGHLQFAFDPLPLQW